MEGGRAPGGPPRHETKPLSLDPGVLTLSCQPASPRSTGRYCRVEGCQTSADELPTQPHTRGRPARRQTELELRPVPPLSPGATRSPSRTAVRAERAEKRQAASSPSPCHQQGCCPRAGDGCGCVVGSRGSPVVKVNIPVHYRNATSPKETTKEQGFTPRTAAESLGLHENEAHIHNFPLVIAHAA